AQAPPAAAAIAILCQMPTVLAHLFPAAGEHERTFLAVKPDGGQRRLVGEILRRYERKGFKLVALKLVQASDELLREHYAGLRERPFYGGLVDYMRSGPVVAMVSAGGAGRAWERSWALTPPARAVWQGLDVVRASRALIGATDPADAAPGTIRGDFCVEVGKNVIHGSDLVESARREIALWFRGDKLLCWEDSAEPAGPSCADARDLGSLSLDNKAVNPPSSRWSGAGTQLRY
ncbi:nucleoside diphosphate kinase 3, partial [Canis lupus baileyi]|uniref:nucleoside diphosphate kinase 3 n=1 Tax=Canis lupus familiaris TaxID=9615 RepID=UPI000BAA28DE